MSTAHDKISQPQERLQLFNMLRQQEQIVQQNDYKFKDMNFHEPQKPPGSKKQQNTAKRNHRVPTTEYSKIIQSFNKRFADLYSLEQNDNPILINSSNNSTNHNYQGSKTINENATITHNRQRVFSQLTSTIKPFTIEAKQQQKCGTNYVVVDELLSGSIQKIPYEGISNVDPYLLQVGSQLDEEHKRKKQALIEQTFVKRYQQLVHCQKHFQIYRQEKQSQTKSLTIKIEQMMTQNQRLVQRGQQLSEDIIKTREECKNNFKQMNKDHQAEINQYSKTISQMTQKVSLKDNEITSLHKLTIPQLQSRLDEQISQNLQLKSNIQQLISSITQKDQQLSEVTQKHKQLIQTLQKSLTHCQNQRNSLSQDFQRICEQHHKLKQSHTQLTHNFSNLQSQVKRKNLKMQTVLLQISQTRQKHQNQLYEYKIKYLQQLQEKNAIIDQYEEAKESLKGMEDELSQVRSKGVALEGYLRDMEREIKTERVMYVEECAKYQGQISGVKEKMREKQIILQRLQRDIRTTNKQHQQITASLTHQIITLQATLTHQTQHITHLQTQLTHLNQYKESHINTFNQTKSSFISITQELKTQLSKAKQIIKSKNDQINQTRQQNHVLRQQIRELKDECCKFENQLYDMRESMKVEINERDEQRKIVKEDLKKLREETVKEVEQRDKQIRILEENIREYQKSLRKRLLQVSSLQLQAQSIAKTIQQDKILINQLQNQLQLKIRKVNENQKSSNQKIINLQKQHNIQKQSLHITYSHQKQTLISEYQQKIRLKDNAYTELRQQLISAQKQVQKITGFLVQTRNQKQQISSLCQQLSKKIFLLQSQANQKTLQLTILQDKYHNQNRLILSNIQQRQQPISLPNNQPLKPIDQNTPIHPNENSPKLSFNSQQKLLETKYLKIIQQMKLQIMELTLYFKQKSSEQQELRKILQLENQELTSKLMELNPIMQCVDKQAK